jgi:plastocyanin
LLAGACLAVARPQGVPRRAVELEIRDFQFVARDTMVAVGDTVVWINRDAFLHTITADSGAWSSPEVRQGERFTFVALRAGRFPYHCAAHPVMRATLAVRP